jgi:transcription initiation factor TFIID subunit 13
MESSSSSSNKRSRMHDDLEEMMYGFGDSWRPDADAVRALEQITIEYIEDVTQRSLQVAELTGKLDKECVLYVVRKDRKKFNRVHQLLTADEIIKSANDLVKTSSEAPMTSSTEAISAAAPNKS